MKLRIEKFGATWCPPCVAADKAGTFERFAEKHPDVRVKIHTDTDAGSAAFQRKADEMKIRNLPTIIWLYGEDELFRTYDLGIRALETAYAKAVKKAGI